MTRPLTIAACLALAVLPLAAAAQDADAEQAAPSIASPQAAPGGVPDNGRVLTYTCIGCHGVVGYRNAYPNYHVPKIGGQSEVYLTNALKEYRKGERRHPTMQSQAQSFSDQDIADIAAFLSGLQK